MTPHSSTLAWKIPWMEEPGRLQSMWLLRVGHNWATSLSLFTFMRWRRKWQPTPVFLPGEPQGRGNLVGCRLWGHSVGHDWSDLAAAAALMLIMSNSLYLPFGTKGSSRRLKHFSYKQELRDTEKDFWLLYLGRPVPVQFQSLLFFNTPQSWGAQMLNNKGNNILIEKLIINHK